MKVGVVRFPGSNCDEDVALAVEALGAQSRFLWHRERDLGDLDLVILPGGFSYGDYLRAGAIASLSPIMGDVVRFAEGGGPVLGICNGFQILCETGLLPGALVRNQSLKFHSHDVHVRVERTDTRFTTDYAEGQVLRIPVANAEGNYRADPDVLAALQAEGRVVFRYCDAHGGVGGQGGEGGTGGEAGNFDPSGSANHIAGIINAHGNVLGMMPHPERAMDARLGSTDGRGLFTSLLASLAGSAA
jgi:phosphoribosylformylglycinamidine synthase I